MADVAAAGAGAGRGTSVVIVIDTTTSMIDSVHDHGQSMVMQLHRSEPHTESVRTINRIVIRIDLQ